MSTALGKPSVEQLVAGREILVCCGAGGVGKTSVAASIAATAAARSRGRVLVITVDPARRLADALGMRELSNEATPVPRSAFEAAGVRPQGELFAAMLDVSRSWDDLVRRHAPDEATAGQILDNALYKNVSRRFAQGQSYIAVERLYELYEEGEYDLLVVDTPPARSALDILDAPQQMREFFTSRLLGWLTMPYRSRLFNLASRPFYQVGDRVLGSEILRELADFFILFQTMREGFVARALAVEALLRDLRTAFVLVTGLEAVPAKEALAMKEALCERHLALGLVVANRVLPSSLARRETAIAGEVVAREAANLGASAAAALGVEASIAERVLDEVAASYANFRQVAARQSEVLRELSATGELMAVVPYLPGQVSDLSGLLTMGATIWGDREPGGGARS